MVGSYKKSIPFFDKVSKKKSCTGAVIKIMLRY